MPKINNAFTEVETPLPQLEKALQDLPPGQKVYCNNTRDEILKTKENLTKRRHEIHGADSHLAYIEALLIAEANGQLQFKP